MATYWAILGKIWATFYSNISSQCLRLSDLFTFDCIEKTKFKTKRSEMAKRCLKSSKSCFYIRVRFFKKFQKVANYFGYFCLKFCH